MLFALDAMGGDHAPKEPCLGAIRACRENKDLSIVLIGAADQIEPLLADVESSVRSRLHIVHTG
jgi:Fatty acid/phospholipid biosynthesis enzyme